MNVSASKKYLYALYILTLLFCIATGIIIFIEDGKADFTDTMSFIPDRTILIIDPGHGGADGGAVAADGSIESAINLAVALKLDSLAHFFGVESLMTRTDESLAYPDSASSIAEKKRWDQRTRLELINSAENAVLISIHQNYYPDPRPVGPQVLYGKSEASKALGELCHGLLNENLCPENRRVAAPALDNIYLMKNAGCTAILVECGFMSNAGELQMLRNDEYQKKLAAIMLASYLCHIN